MYPYEWDAVMLLKYSKFSVMFCYGWDAEVFRTLCNEWIEWDAV